MQYIQYTVTTDKMQDLVFILAETRQYIKHIGLIDTKKYIVLCPIDKNTNIAYEDVLDLRYITTNNEDRVYLMDIL